MVIVFVDTLIEKAFDNLLSIKNLLMKLRMISKAYEITPKKIDLDKAITWGPSTGAYPNQTSPKSFMIFNRRSLSFWIIVKNSS